MTEISVIMPVFNAERHLRACLESVLGQSLREIEVVCVNDGSADGSLRILQELAAKDGRICVIDRPNGGAAIARNAALDVARGEYIAFMDADDLYPARDVLARLYEAASASAADLCGGRMEKLLPDGSVRQTDDPPYWGFTTYLYRRSLLEDAKIRFPAYRTFEDPPFLVGAMARANHVEKVDFATYRYRVDYRVSGDRSLADPVRGRDYLRGLTDVVRLARAAGLEDVLAAVRDLCRAQETLGLVMELLRRDPRTIEPLCRLVAAFPEDDLPPFMEQVGLLAGRCHTSSGAFLQALRGVKAALGSRYPDQLKFWRQNAGKR